ncbi:MAG: triose-phosphate isomerase [Sulfobacillus acidophilus]|uniref:Triosephosphate isomerase n=1 Tax=Sulfobacillus acidophilus TaxID=53633 RepID=A0A2T2WJ95_9FIRM|nr:MAG: triose-phosphate isomerase [Sulfobacillus acidophilus]
MNQPTLMVANWKMHKTVDQSRAYVRELLRRRQGETIPSITEVICPTVVALWGVARILAESEVAVGAQNVDVGREGAHTGAVSPYLLHEAGAHYAIVGHSERRQLYGEDDELVAAKAVECVNAQLIPVVCVGESREEREAGATDGVIARQVSAVMSVWPDGASADVVFAYEPIWAIGTGLVADAAEAGRVARLIRDTVHASQPQRQDSVRVLYGGSVTRENIAQFAQESLLSGALVGGASLDVGHWMDLIRVWKEVRS